MRSKTAETNPRRTCSNWDAMAKGTAEMAVTKPNVRFIQSLSSCPGNILTPYEIHSAVQVV